MTAFKVLPFDDYNKACDDLRGTGVLLLPPSMIAPVAVLPFGASAILLYEPFDVDVIRRRFPAVPE